MHYEPATTIIAKFGGIRQVASIAGVSVHTVAKWRLAKDKGGTGGHVPHWHHEGLLKSAREKSIELAPADFFREISTLESGAAA